jgi:hypothetical protein
MTTSPAYGPDHQPRRAFRLGATLGAVLLAVQCVWLLLPELIRPNIIQVPTSASAASAAAKHQSAAAWAAWVARIRGDLWTQSAFTQANLLLQSNAKTDANLLAAWQRTHRTLDDALADAPHASGAWLMLAALTSHFMPAARGDAIEALKLAYFTGPSEQELMPLRLEIAIRLESFDDSDMRPLIGRDIRLLLTQKHEATVGRIYNAASVKAKGFMDQAIGDVDPSAAEKMRSRPSTMPSRE